MYERETELDQRINKLESKVKLLFYINTYIELPLLLLILASLLGTKII